jgi:Fe-S-cluster containining protein
MNVFLIQIQQQVHERVAAIASAHPAWPCHKGCDDCCRSLASEPLVSEAEWQRVAQAIDALPNASLLYDRICATAGQPRPVTCALLDQSTGACLIYDARPIACRTYGFYAERDKVLGCYRIEALAQDPTILWGNHATIEAQLLTLGRAQELSAWLTTSGTTAGTDSSPSRQP